jgi:hypothetical protein
VIPIVVAIVLVAIFAAVAANRGLGPSKPVGSAAAPTVPVGSAAAPTVSVSWQSYRDPADLFSIRLPATWSVHVETSTSTFGDRTGSATETEESIRASDPAQGGSSPWVSIRAVPIRTDFERHWYCQAFPNKHDSFHGIPAESINGVTWLFETGNAHFQIDYAIPGVKEPLHSSPLILTPPPAPTPLPSTTVTADQTLADTILGSFQPASPKALACS